MYEYDSGLVFVSSEHSQKLMLLENKNILVDQESDIFLVGEKILYKDV